MHVILLMAFVEKPKIENIIDATKQSGATGATVINNARGEGMHSGLIAPDTYSSFIIPLNFTNDSS